MINKRYAFGENWKDYLTKMDQTRLETAKKSLQTFLGDIKGKTFLDIGCGSGLFSLAAYFMGASKIYSFDFDKNSVECTLTLWEKENKPKNWAVVHGSVLDNKFIKKIPKYNLVYSWGVLHHTGKMYKSIQKAASLVKTNGLFYISIYNKTRGMFGSKFWLSFKKFYNSSPFFVKRILECMYFCLFCVKKITQFENPLKIINEYSEKRGMNWYNDLKDWFGGYPYEFATADEIINFCEKLGLKIVKVKRVNNLATNEFVFQRVR